MLDKTKYQKVFYVQNERDKRIAVNSKQFKSLVPFDDGISEVTAAYKKIRIDVPNYIACYILQSAKKVLISFVYDFLLKFIARKSFALNLCDTDSIYLMINKPSLEEAVMPEKKDEFLDRLDNYCSGKGKQRHPEAVLPRRCCVECAIVDSKYPGLWKVRLL